MPHGFETHRVELTQGLTHKPRDGTLIFSMQNLRKLSIGRALLTRYIPWLRVLPELSPHQLSQPRPTQHDIVRFGSCVRARTSCAVTYLDTTPARAHLTLEFLCDPKPHNFKRVMLS